MEELIKKVQDRINSLKKQIKEYNSEITTFCNKLLILENEIILEWIDEIIEKNKSNTERSYFETIYHVGIKPHWKVGDILAYYEFESDREGEINLGKIVEVNYDEDNYDWSYTFEDGSYWFESDLILGEAYKKIK